MACGEPPWQPGRRRWLSRFGCVPEYKCNGVAVGQSVMVCVSCQRHLALAFVFNVALEHVK